MISLGRTSPAAFGLRNKAGLLACGRRFRAPPRSPRGSNSLRLLASFQNVLRALGGNASLVLVTTPRAARTPGFDVGLVPFRSPLLRNSQLVSLTPDSDMLKFSGYPAAPRCYGPESERFELRSSDCGCTANNRTPPAPFPSRSIRVRASSVRSAISLASSGARPPGLHSGGRDRQFSRRRHFASSRSSRPTVLRYRPSPSPWPQRVFERFD